MNNVSNSTRGKKLLALLLDVIMIFACTVMPVAGAASPYTNLILESVFFTDGKGMVEVSPSGKDNLVPYVVISKKEDAVPLAGNVIVTIYDGDKLSDVSLFQLNAESTVFGEKAFLIDRTTFKGSAIDFPLNGTAKAFFWNSANQLMPYTAPTDSKMAAISEQYTGLLTFPEVFQNKMNGKFTITKEPGIRKYSHNATPQSIYNWSDATEIFLSVTVNYGSSSVVNRLGTNRNEPITARNFATHFNANEYKKADGQTPQTNFIFTILDDFYSGSTDIHNIPINNLGTSPTTTNISTSINALVRSGSPSGFTWMGRLRRQNTASDGISQKWTAVDGKPGVYKTVQGTSNQPVITLMNFNAKDAYGMPRPYILVDSIDECMAKKGTFFQDLAAKSNVYCNPYEGQQLDDISLQVESGLIDGIRNSSDSTVIFQNIGFMPRVTSSNANQFSGVDYDKSVFGFFGCKFSGGAINALSMAGKYTAYLFDSVCAYGFRDGLNFHSTITDGFGSTVFQVNLTSYCHGDMNRITYSGAVIPNSTNNSNNCSTTHDAMNSLRIGVKAWDSQGCLIGDLGCFSISMGCEAYNFNISGPSDKTAFFAHDSTEAGQITGKRKYVIDCLGTGTRLRAGLTGDNYTYFLDFVGNTRTCLENTGAENPLKPITWAEISSGTWKETQ